MAVTRCAVVPVGGGRVINVVIADPSVDRPYIGSVFVPLVDDERCDDRFQYDGIRNGNLRFRPVSVFEGEYYEGIREKGRAAKRAGLEREERYPAGSDEKAAYDDGYDAVVVRNP